MSQFWVNEPGDTMQLSLGRRLGLSFVVFEFCDFVAIDVFLDPTHEHRRKGSAGDCSILQTVFEGFEQVEIEVIPFELSTVAHAGKANLASIAKYSKPELR